MHIVEYRDISDVQVDFDAVQLVLRSDKGVLSFKARTNFRL